jgi:broad specificity phosphatase PhoE
MSFEVMESQTSRMPRRGKKSAPVPRGQRAPISIVLIRHGKPAIGKGRLLGHKTFQDYIEAYEQAGLDPNDPPPEWLVNLMRKARNIFASDRPRARESAKALAPHARVLPNALFMEAQLKSPKVPLVRMNAPVWAVVARLAWHAGHHGGIEDYRDAKARALKAVEILGATAEKDGIAVLVAHGYFNAMIGRMLSRQGWRKHGRHRAKFWNAVTYELA